MSAQFNRLNPAQHERLAILSEELGEAQQAVGKILRHGYESYDPTLIVPEDERPPDNQSNLEKELGDVVFAIGLMANNGDLSRGRIEVRATEKVEKIRPYLHHQTGAKSE